MNILNEILNARDGQVVQQMANQFGLGQNEARDAMASMLPALTEGLKRNVSNSRNGVDDLLAVLSGGGHARYVDQPEALSEQRTKEDGENILGHILGTKEVSRQVAGKASGKTGIDPATLKSMLPVLATVVMGALSKKTAGVSGNTTADTLTSLIDLDGDGAVTDDLLEFARKLF
jgi:hypothetical protein